MQDTILYFNSLIEKDSIYWFCALSGTGMFVIQLFLTLVGLDAEAELENDSFADAGKFKWLTRQGVTGFLMIFGLSALSCQKEFELSTGLTLIIAVFCGLLAVFAAGFIFQVVRKLQSSGTVFNIDDTIGKEAYVYHEIPVSGKGKISISLHGFTHELNAVTFESEHIPSFSLVSIIKKIDNHTVFVSKTIRL